MTVSDIPAKRHGVATAQLCCGVAHSQLDLAGNDDQRFAGARGVRFAFWFAPMRYAIETAARRSYEDRHRAR